MSEHDPTASGQGQAGEHHGLLLKRRLDQTGLESSPFPNSNASSVVLTGWAADTTNPTSLVEVVVVLGERVVASAIVDLARPDVAAQYGRPFEYSGFWAADLARGERPRQIVIYRDGEFLVSLGANRQRPDIAAAHDDARLLRTGFRGTVPGAQDPATFSERHRVFAVMLRGAAVELPVRPPEGPAVQQ